MHLLLFHPAEDNGLHVDLRDGGLGHDLGLDLDDILLQAKNLINQMLTVNPAKRIRAEEVISITTKIIITTNIIIIVTTNIITITIRIIMITTTKSEGPQAPLDLPEGESGQRVPQVQRSFRFSFFLNVG